MNALTLAQSRYTCKAYDGSFELDGEVEHRLLEALRLAPSAVNSQPWHFFVAKTTHAKERLTTAMQGANAHNIPKVMQSALVVVFAVKTQLDNAHTQAVIEAEAQAGRFVHQEAKNQRLAYCQAYIDGMSGDECLVWSTNQVYLSAGFWLALVQAEGLDATPIEGFDRHRLDKELNLAHQGLNSLMMIAIGKKSPQDANATLPKGRLPSSQVMTLL